MRFDGHAYNHDLDSERLTKQCERIKNLMEDKTWRTLSEISLKTNSPEASASAHLRDLRKKRFGRKVVEKRRRGDKKSGLFEYRVMPKGYESEYTTKPRRNKYREALEKVWTHPDCTKGIKETIKEVLK